MDVLDNCNGGHNIQGIIVGGEIVYPWDAARIEKYLAVTRSFLEKYKKSKHCQTQVI